MAERYQSSAKKSTKKFEVMGSKEVAVRLPLPLVEVWEELQPEVEHLTGLAGLKIIRAVIEEEVMRRVGPRHQPEHEDWSLQESDLDNYRKRCNMTCRDSNSQAPFPKEPQNESQ